MAIALQKRSSSGENHGLFWRWSLAVGAILALLVMVALSGGFQLAPPAPEVGSPDAPATQGPPLDGRGKWTGYTR